MAELQMIMEDRGVYYDSSGGTNTKRNIKIQFRAKEGIVTSNPTDISITAEGSNT